MTDYTTSHMKMAEKNGKKSVRGSLRRVSSFFFFEGVGDVKANIEPSTEAA